MAKATFYSVPGLRKALRKLPKLANAELREASGLIAEMVAEAARERAMGQGKLAAIVAPTIRRARDRVPAVQMGSSTKLPTSGSGWRRERLGASQTIGDVIWGAEFGGGRSLGARQFLPWRGNDEGAGYFLWPTVRDQRDSIRDAYSEALGDALGKVKP